MTDPDRQAVNLITFLRSLTGEPVPQQLAG
jgi:hypothetical protein